MVDLEKILTINPMVILREDFDEWAILFNADTGKGYGLNPTAVFIWKCLEGGATPNNVIAEVKKYHNGVPETVSVEITNLINQMMENGLTAEIENAD